MGDRDSCDSTGTKTSNVTANVFWKGCRDKRGLDLISDVLPFALFESFGIGSNKRN